MDYKNKVELLGLYGSDETHSLSAWCSTSRELTEEKRNRMDKLLLKLASEGHHTPFEKSSIHFLITTDIATHIQLLKHRIGVSVNAQSARYMELKSDTFYIPEDWPIEEQKSLIKHCESSLEQYHATLRRLIDGGMAKSRAKESSRFYLPYANHIKSDVLFNFRSFMFFQKLRNENHAQLEIKNLAQEMLEEVIKTNKFNLSLKAFGWLE